MINKMEGSGGESSEVASSGAATVTATGAEGGGSPSKSKNEPTAGTKGAAGTGTGTGKEVSVGVDAASGDSDSNTDAGRFSREKNLLLLSALYNVYGEEWNEAPDWEKVATTIKDSKLPVYGEGFTAEVCEKQYKDLIENGVELGVHTVKVVLKPPKRYTDAEKRLWLLAQISTDIVRTSDFMEKKMRHQYNVQMKIMEMIAKSDLITEEWLEKQYKFPSPSSESSLSGEENLYTDEFEDPEADKAAVQLWQLEVLEGIVGMQDVLKLVRYCNDAAEHAVNRYKSVTGVSPIVKPRRTPLAQASSASTSTSSKPPTESAEEKKPEPSSSSEVGSSEQEKDKVSSQDSEDRKNDTRVSTPPPGNNESETGYMELLKTPPQPIKQHSIFSSERTSFTSPELRAQTEIFVVTSAPSPSTSGSIASNSIALSAMSSQEQSSSYPSSQESTSTTATSTTIVSSSTNGDISSPESIKLSPFKNDSSKTRNPALNRAPDLKVIEVIDLATPPKSEENKAEPRRPPGTEKNDSSSSNSTEDNENEKKDKNIEQEEEKEKEGEPKEKELGNDMQPEEEKEQDKGVKGKATGGRRSVGAARKIVAKRTSSRFASPDPEPSAQNDEDSIPKRTRARHSSNTEVNANPTIKLRRRRGPSPTPKDKDSGKESENLKETSKATTDNSKSDSAGIDENEEDTFETPRTTPETPEMKAVVEPEIIQDKPKIKTYSAKDVLSSPLAHVDPRVFEEFIDDDEGDDPELAMIDNNINKSKSDKLTSATVKTNSRRGRTVSTDNTPENNEENSQPKRVTRRAGLNDDAEESTESTEASNDDKSKRLTRSSLKIHDATNDEGTEPSSRTGSEKAGSESSFGGGKEKKPRQSRGSSERTSYAQMRVKKLSEEKRALYGEDDVGEKTVDGKRVTRARAKTSTGSNSEKRGKPSTAESEGGNENESTPTRSTRSRASTSVSTVGADIATVVPQLAANEENDEEKNKATASFRKAALALVDKLASHEAGTAIQKFIDDPEKRCKKTLSFQDIKHRIENGKTNSPASVHTDLTLLALNAAMVNPNSVPAKEAVTEFHKLLKENTETIANLDSKRPRTSSSQKIDNSDVESLESHEETRSEIASKPAAGASGRRKRRRSASETSEEVFVQEKRRVTRTSLSSTLNMTPTGSSRKPKHPISPDIVSANRNRH